MNRRKFLSLLPAPLLAYAGLKSEPVKADDLIIPELTPPKKLFQYVDGWVVLRNEKGKEVSKPIKFKITEDGETLLCEQLTEDVVFDNPPVGNVTVFYRFDHWVLGRLDVHATPIRPEIKAFTSLTITTKGIYNGV